MKEEIERKIKDIRASLTGLTNAIIELKEEGVDMSAEAKQYIEEKLK